MLFLICTRLPITGSFLFLTSLFAFGFVVQAEDPIAYSDYRGDREELRTEERFIPRYAVAGGYISWASDADFSSTLGSLSQWETGVQANVPFFETDKIRLTAGIQYRYNRLKFTGALGPLADMDFDLHRVDIPVNFWADLNPRWKLWLRLQPGWYSDFDNVGSDDFILTTLALMSYQWNEKARIAFGGYYSRDLGEPRLLPAVGFIFEPDPQWSIALTFPRAEVAYAPNRDWFIAGRVFLSGAGWNITDPAGGSNDVDLDYKSMRIGLGVERRLSGPWWAYLDGGAQMGQEISIEEAPYVFERELDASVFVTGGVKLRF